MMKNMMTNPTTQTMQVTDCLALSARVYGIPKGQILTRRKYQNVAHARQAAMLLASECGNSLSHIKRVMGFSDHTTIIHGIRAAKARRDAEIERQQKLRKDAR